MEFQALDLDSLCKQLTGGLGLPVINRTGITGRFDIRLEFARDDEAVPGVAALFARDAAHGYAAPPPDRSDPPGPSILDAIQQQLGLKLEPTEAPREFLVIDSVEKPTEN